MPKRGYFFQSLFSLLPLWPEESFRIHLEASGKVLVCYYSEMLAFVS